MMFICTYNTQSKKMSSGYSLLMKEQAGGINILTGQLQNTRQESAESLVW